MREILENQRKNKRIKSYDLSYSEHFTAKFYQIIFVCNDVKQKIVQGMS